MSHTAFGIQSQLFSEGLQQIADDPSATVMQFSLSVQVQSVGTRGSTSWQRELPALADAATEVAEEEAAADDELLLVGVAEAELVEDDSADEGADVELATEKVVSTRL